MAVACFNSFKDLKGHFMLMHNPSLTTGNLKFSDLVDMLKTPMYSPAYLTSLSQFAREREEAKIPICDLAKVL